MRIRLAITSVFICLAMAFSSIPAVKVQAAGVPSWATLNTGPFSTELIQDIAVSPNYAQDKTIFVLTELTGSDVVSNIWRTQDGANTWQEVFAGTSGTEVDFVGLSPDYGKTYQAVYLLGSLGGNPLLWRSQDAGASWQERAAPAGIQSEDQLLVASDTGVFICGSNTSPSGTQAYVYYSANGGISFNAGAAVGDKAIYSMALSPTYAQDHTLLIGNTNGGVFWSNDGGSSFSMVSSVILSGTMLVAFDENFAATRTVYTASDNAGGGIYSTNVGVGQPWQRLDNSTPADETLGGLAVSSAGVLYALSNHAVSAANSQGGMLRCVNSVSPALFERVNGGLSDGATLSEGVLECVGSQLWAIDSADNRLVAFIDTLSQPVNLITPANNSAGTGVLSGGSVNGVLLSWQALAGAATYQWQVSANSNFTVILNGFSGNSSGTTVAAPSLAPVSIYFWRVRAIAPLYSPWSAVWSFGTPSPTVEVGAPQLINPPVAANIALKPLFQWSAVPGATSYDLIVSESQDFSNPVISKTGGQGPGQNQWQCDAALDYATFYYWQVRAITASVAGPWSPAGYFETLNGAATTVTVTTGMTPPAPSQTATAILPAASEPAVSTTPPASTGSPPIIPPIPGGTPDWVYYAVTAGAAVVVLLAGVLLLARGNRRRLL